MNIPGIIDKIADMRKTSQTKQHEISAAEAGNMWNKLVGRYDLTESIMVLINFVKDEDLRKEVQNLLKKINRQIIELEKVMAEHAVSLALQPASEIKITEKIASVTDRVVFTSIYYSLKRFLPVHIVAFQQSTSPKIRAMFKSFLLEEMDLFEKFQDFGLVKNWLPPQPEYNNEKINSQGNPTIMEASQLWNKLNSRYETLELTNYMANLATDSDLKAAIAIGQELLQKHISILEKMMQKYAVPLPIKPPEAENTARPLDAISDRYIFRQILKGIQSFLPVHMVAFQQSVNPEVRKQFKSLLIEEIDIYDTVFVYGQLKGWVLKPPSFKG